MRGERRDAKFTLHRAIDLRHRQEPKPFRGTPQSPKPHCTRRLVARVRWFLWCIYSPMIGAVNAQNDAYNKLTIKFTTCFTVNNYIYFNVDTDYTA